MLVYLRKLGEKREAEKKALAAAKVKSRADAKGSKKGGPVGPVTIAVKVANTECVYFFIPWFIFRLVG
jgi:hypothetical protein